MVILGNLLQDSDSIEFEALQTFFSPNSSASYFLVKLTFYNLMNWSSESVFPQISENFKLPHLRDLTIWDFRSGQLPAGTMEKYQAFVQALLNSTVTLKKTVFSSQVANFIDLMLPPSLIELSVSPQNLLNLLTSSFNTQSPSSSTFRLQLPQLKQLTCRGESMHPFQTAMRYQIGNNFRALMPQVEKLVLECIQENLVIDVLCLCHPAWLNWPTITTLAIDMSISTTPQCIDHIHRAFGVLANLELVWFWDYTLSGQYADPLRSALGFIFRKMTRLESLKISFYHLEYVEEFEWDSLIIGTTSERAKHLREDPSLWEEFLKEDNQNTNEQGQGDTNGSEQQLQRNSIRDMKQLRRLHLSGKFSYTPRDDVPHPARIPPPSIMSTLAFRLGFMQLTQLYQVTLSGFPFGMCKVAEECMKEFPGRTIQIID